MHNIVVVFLHLVQAQLLPTAGFELKKNKIARFTGYQT